MENVITQESSKAIEFNYYLPVNIVFGSGKVNKAGELAKPYGKKALIVTGKSSANVSFRIYYNKGNQRTLKNP